MKLTEPLPDTEQSLFYSAINALRIAGVEKLADDLSERMEKICDHAPEMLEALQCFESAYAAWNNRGEGGEDDLHHAVRVARAAINKAEGRTE